VLLDGGESGAGGRPDPAERDDGQNHALRVRLRLEELDQRGHGGFRTGACIAQRDDRIHGRYAGSLGDDTRQGIDGCRTALPDGAERENRFDLYVDRGIRAGGPGQCGNGGVGPPSQFAKGAGRLPPNVRARICQVRDGRGDGRVRLAAPRLQRREVHEGHCAQRADESRELHETPLTVRHVPASWHWRSAPGSLRWRQGPFQVSHRAGDRVVTRGRRVTLVLTSAGLGGTPA
jgi:hypothetical protein